MTARVPTTPTARLDRLLGRVTMYRLVTLTLLILAVVSIVLAATGSIGALTTPGTSASALPVAMIVTLIVLLVWSYLSNRVLAAIFRVTPHSESAIITGYLLFFILSPSLDVAGLLATALVAVLANASKYLIAVRGRHIVNPAAFGALLGYSLGLVNTPWWVGQLWLLPFVVVLGAAVVIRTRRVDLVAVFLVVAIVARSAQFALTGLSPLDGATFVFQYAPVVFLACYMLTEPLTLAPRRREQYLVAAIVAVVMVLPIALDGPTLGILHLQLTTAPELALVVGNVVAFLFGQRRGVRLLFRSRRQLTPTSWEFEFEPAAPVRYRAGQYLELHLPHSGQDARGARRTFSIASAPDSAVRLGLRVPTERSSSFKRALLEIEPGTRVTATAVGGDFTLPPATGEPLLLVAGGIGITPFVAQLGDARARGEERDVVLVYAVSSTDDIAYAVELADSGARVVIVAPEPLTRMPEHWHWVEGPLTAEKLLAEVPDAARRRAYLSGPPGLISALRPALRRAGARRIHTDAFLGY